MDVSSFIDYLPPYALHVALLASVVLSAVLVFVFSFKNVGEPPFSERKAAGKKKKQPKEKKSLNGHATIPAQHGDKQTVKVEGKKDGPKSPSKSSEKVRLNEVKKEKVEAAPSKRALKENQQPKEKKSESAKSSPKEQKAAKKQGKGKENVETKNKKNLIRLAPMKHKEDGGGQWEQAISRKERRARKAQAEDILSEGENDGSVPKGRGGKAVDKETKNDKTSAKTESSVPELNNESDKHEKEVTESVPVKKIPEAKQNHSSKSDEVPEGSSTVYDEFAEVFKEPSKKAIKKRVRKE